jgi:hypothetical protein
MEARMKRKRAEIVQDYNPEEPTEEAEAVKNLFSNVAEKNPIVNSIFDENNNNLGSNETENLDLDEGEDLERDENVARAVIKEEAIEFDEPERDMDVELKAHTAENYDEYQAAMRLKQGSSFFLSFSFSSLSVCLFF